MAEALAEGTQALESTTVGIYRTASVVQGGRRFSFAALVVVGDRKGNVGIGYGKAPGVPAAIEKAQKDARKQLFHIALHQGTLPHPVTGRHGASKVLLAPAAPGTGVVASGTVRAVLEMAGVSDCLTKCHGSTNKKNVAKAVINGLQGLQMKDDVAARRGVELGSTEVEEKIEAARKFMAETAGEEAAATTETPGAESGEQAKSGVQAQVQPTPAEQKQPQPQAEPEQQQTQPPAGQATSGEQAKEADEVAQGEQQGEADQQGDQGGEEQKQEGT